MIYDCAKLEDRVLGKALAFQALQRPRTVWLRSDEGEITFAAGDELVNRYANGMAGLGLRKGATLALLMAPSIEVPLLALAAARLGVIFTTINTDFRGTFLQEALKQADATVLIIDGQLVGRLQDIDVGPVQHVFVKGASTGPEPDGAKAVESLRDSSISPPTVTIEWSDPAQVWWSSGTTGKSKGIVHGHSSLMHLAWHYATERFRDGDVLYSCTPVYLGSPWTGIIWPSIVGGYTAAIDPHFSVSHFWERVRHFRATYFFTLGAMHMHLWKRPPEPGDASTGVRYAQAVPMNWNLIPQFKRRFGIQDLSQAYGTSETFIVFDARDDGTPWNGAAMGKPVSYLEVKLLDETDHEVPVGTVGEICVRPKEPGLIFLGYFREPALTLQAWRNLWHHTGDMALRDEAGVFFFADRKKDYIRYNGRNISMFEVEAVVETHPDVADVAAYGIASVDLESESELIINVICKAGCCVTPEALATFLNDNAPYYFVPRYIVFTDSLPRNPHGRVLKHVLRDQGLPATAWDRRKAGFQVRR
jgi:crotonobetaine/carnitine-CoA ligase